jgi:S-DNA-T family DNA segregation ATPase FtsK/SpoIIIE
MAAETITEEIIPAAETKPPASKPKATRKARAKKPSTTSKSKSTPKRAPSRRKSSARSKKSSEPAISPKAAALPREVGGLVCVALALAVFLAIVSFTPADLEPGAKVANLIGPVGARVGDVLLTIFGLGSLCFDALLWYLGVSLLVGRRPHARPTELAGYLAFVLAGTALAHLTLAGSLFFGHRAGGVVGEFSAELTRGLVGTVGAYIVAVSLLILSLMLSTSMSLSAIVRAIGAQIARARAYAAHQWRVHSEYRARLAEERERLLREDGAGVHEQARLQAELAVQPIGQDSYAFEENFDDQVESKLASKLNRLFGRYEDDPPAKKTRARKPSKKKGEEPAEAAAPADDWSMGALAPVKGDAAHAVDAPGGDTMQIDGEDVVAEEATSDSPTIHAGASKTKASPKKKEEPAAEEEDGPRIVESTSKDRARRIKELLTEDDEDGVLFKPQVRGDFELPAVHFLNYEDDPEQSVDIDTLRAMAAQIEKTLSDFKVDGQIKDICPGPVITVFEFSPAPGVKISKIANLSDDLAMALSALSVRIVAPIPGKGVVGIEVPNPTREIVYMKEIIADEVFMGDKKKALPMGLGKDTAGNPIVTDLAKMPHLLVAGATGSGKSVAVNTMITSLLYKNSPDDVRMIMVDPKMLEFSIYADIPHLLLPVVTDPKQATVALNWVVNEMERRYQNLADLNVRNIKGYNAKVDKLTRQAEADMASGLEESPSIATLGIGPDGTPEHQRLPYIVVVIDEFADLMMTASKDVETAVARLAQKARAAGIHLILATQRPSTDVITGLIKANFPTRIALRVTSKTDSRVILDSNGAEALLGNGDMLFVPPGTSYVQRVHGAYVSEEEIDKIVAFLKTQGEPQYNDEILKVEDEEGEDAIEEWERDEHYADAVRLVIESKQASISMIQRKLRVGYNRAARMVEHMEREGLVAPADGCKPREVIATESPY